MHNRPDDVGGPERVHPEARRVSPLASGRPGDLALAFSESSASSAEVLVTGESFYPRMLDDIRAATYSVHVSQFGFRPGFVGDTFADALIAKAAEGVPVRVIVDRRGSDPEGGARAHYERLASGGVQVWVVRATQVRAQDGRLGGGGANRWNLGALGHFDHRKLARRRRSDRLGRRRRHRGSLPGRPLPRLFVRVTGRSSNQLQLVFLASLRWLGGAVPATDLDALFPALDAGRSGPAVVLHNAPGRFRPITSAIARDDRRRAATPSTSPTRTSPTAG